MASFDELWDAQVKETPKETKVTSFDELWNQQTKESAPIKSEPKQEDLKGQKIWMGGQEFDLSEIGPAELSTETTEDMKRYYTDIISGLGGMPKAVLQMPEGVTNQLSTLISGEEAEPVESSEKNFLFRGLDALGSFLPSSGDIRGAMTDKEADALDRIIMGTASGLPFGLGGAAFGAAASGLEEGLTSVNATPRVKAGAQLGLLAGSGLKLKEGLQFKGPEKPVGNFLRKMGLADEQIAPVLAGKNPKRMLNKLATKKGKTELVLDATKQGLEGVYENLRERPEAEMVLDIPKRVEMEQSFNEILKDLPSRDRSRIQTDLQDFYNSPRTVSDAINLYRDINAEYGTRSPKGLRLKEPIVSMIEEISPEFAQDFKLANEAYRDYASIRRELRPKDVSTFSMNIEKYPPLAVVASFLYGNPSIGFKIAGLTYAAPKVAREMVINPKLKNLSRKLSAQLSRKSFGVANTTKEQLADEVSNIDPEVAEAIRQANLEDFFEKN